ncbi:MAG: NUDIX domain-containing protein [Microthrixaceae bacterium]
MPLSPYIKMMRERVGHDLLLLPTVAVLPRDERGRVLLVRQIDTGKWGTIGGSMEPDESPETAAIREAAEEAGIKVQLNRLITVTGGPDFRVSYPNGDEVACVSVVFEAVILEGTPRPDDDETSEVGWFDPPLLENVDLNDFNRKLLAAVVPLLD